MPEYAPMTKNNLSSHLKWLLKQGPSLYPSLTPSARDLENDSIARNRAVDELATTVDITEPDLVYDSVKDSQIIATDLADESATNDEVTDNAKMARLLFDPQSAKQPRMLSSSRDAKTPKSSFSRKLEESSTQPRGTQQRNGFKGIV